MLNFFRLFFRMRPVTLFHCHVILTSASLLYFVTRFGRVAILTPIPVVYESIFGAVPFNDVQPPPLPLVHFCALSFLHVVNSLFSQEYENI